MTKTFKINFDPAETDSDSGPGMSEQAEDFITDADEAMMASNSLVKSFERVSLISPEGIGITNAYIHAPDFYSSVHESKHIGTSKEGLSKHSDHLRSKEGIGGFWVKGESVKDFLDIDDETMEDMGLSFVRGKPYPLALKLEPMIYGDMKDINPGPNYDPTATRYYDPKFGVPPTPSVVDPFSGPASLALLDHINTEPLKFLKPALYRKKYKATLYYIQQGSINQFTFQQFKAFVRNHLKIDFRSGQKISVAGNINSVIASITGQDIYQNQEDVLTALEENNLIKANVSDYYYDHTFTANAAFDSENLIDSDSPAGTKSATITSHYNAKYYMQAYENLTAQENIRETSLPNLYTFFYRSQLQESRNNAIAQGLSNEIVTEIVKKNMKWNYLVNLGGIIPFDYTMPDAIFKSGKTNSLDLNEGYSWVAQGNKGYYNAWRTFYNSCINDEEWCAQYSKFVKNDAGETIKVSPEPGSQEAIDTRSALMNQAAANYYNVSYLHLYGNESLPLDSSNWEKTYLQNEQEFTQINYMKEEMPWHMKINLNDRLFGLQHDHVGFKLYQTNLMPHLLTILMRRFKPDWVSGNQALSLEEGFNMNRFIVNKDGSVNTKNTFEDSETPGTSLTGINMQRFADGFPGLTSLYGQYYEDFYNWKDKDYCTIFSNFEKNSNVLNFTDEQKLNFIAWPSKVFKNSLLGLAKKYCRSYHDIVFKGMPARTQTIAYRIIKSDIEGNILQNMYIPYFASKPSVEIIDTQVKYGKEYNYQIFAEELIFGTRYAYTTKKFGYEEFYDILADQSDSYTNLDFDDFYFKNITNDDQELQNMLHGQVDTEIGGFESAFYMGAEGTVDNVTYQSTPIEAKGIYQSPDLPWTKNNVFKFEFEIIEEPSLMLAEIPWFNADEESYNNIVLDKPPVPPDVTFYPYRASVNELIVSISPNTGLYKNLMPVEILDQDLPLFARHYMAQKRSAMEGLEFSNDDYVSQIQVFEASELPSSYQDLNFSAIETVGAYDLPMVPNEYKYLAFRSVDRHGNVSNPTPVYSLRLVTLNENISSADQASYLEVNAFVPTDAVSPQPLKTASFKRFLKIKPSELQEQFNYEALENLETAMGEMPPLGDSIEESVLEPMKTIDAEKGVVNQPKKKYKLRIKSTTTGRVIDINFAFRMKKKPLTAIDFENI